MILEYSKICAFSNIKNINWPNLILMSALRMGYCHAKANSRNLLVSINSKSLGSI